MFCFSCVLMSVFISMCDICTLVHAGTWACPHAWQRRPLGGYNTLSLIIILRLNTTRLESKRPPVSASHCAGVTDKSIIVSSFLSGHWGLELRSSCLYSKPSYSLKLPPQLGSVFILLKIGKRSNHRPGPLSQVLFCSRGKVLDPPTEEQMRCRSKQTKDSGME